jgi:hypothetical protein
MSFSTLGIQLDFQVIGMQGAYHRVNVNLICEAPTTRRLHLESDMCGAEQDFLLNLHAMRLAWADLLLNLIC